MLSDQQVQQYERDGYLVVPNFATAEETKQLRDRALQLVAGFEPNTKAIFSTKNQKATTNQYFMDSGSNISFFFEEQAHDKQGNLRQAKELSINKIGHAMHDLDPVFRSFSRSDRVARLLESLHYRRPLPVQSMFIFKQPKIGGEVVPHQDSTFLYTDPPTVVGLWWALEDATVDNGCLFTLPGSHREGPARRMLTTEDREGVTFDKDAPAWDLQDFVPVEVKAGSLVLLHGANVHYSNENSSGISRHAYSVHVCEGAGDVSWAADNWMQRRPELPFEPLYDHSAAVPA
ncbi:hypothetical protein WJX73_003968 [Symbiochloris irregularis]|uniref:Phytanoyl-CoA dioxygenase n=1 Tax=Symbiochloris irregularis TaxID=706552 RepID=A0AAW1P2J3_9CHLO